MTTRQKPCSAVGCTTTTPHHTHSDVDGRSWCCQDESPYTTRLRVPAPAHPDRQGTREELAAAIANNLVRAVRDWHRAGATESGLAGLGQLFRQALVTAPAHPDRQEHRRGVGVSSYLCTYCCETWPCAAVEGQTS